MYGVTQRRSELALIKCPDCDKDVSDAAPSCPNCGHPFSTVSQAPVGKKEKKTSRFTIGCLVVFIVAAGVSVIGTLFQKNNPAPQLVKEGDVVSTKKDSFCGSSPEALDDMVKWAARGDVQEALRVMLKTRSSLVGKGDTVKILDVGIIRTKVRQLKTDRECWLIPEAVR